MKPENLVFRVINMIRNLDRFARAGGNCAVLLPASLSLSCIIGVRKHHTHTHTVPWHSAGYLHYC
jgi:hypothetical protein